MRLLLDSCVWGPAAAELRAAGHDVAAVADWPGDPGDDAVLDAAMGEGRVLVTLDKDFGEIAILRGRAHSGIVRLVGFAARRAGRRLPRRAGPVRRRVGGRRYRRRLARPRPHPHRPLRG